MLLSRSFLLLMLVPGSISLRADDLLTVAEESQFTKTASYAQVIDLIDRIESQSSIVRRTELGRSFEGRSLPLMILANPPVATAAEARASGRTIVFAFANIHAGEVCGKESLLILARELATQPDHEFFDDLIIVLAPIYNADGNERFGPVARNRPGQVGPEEVGIRANAQGLDLNRDYVKLEAPETRAMLQFVNEWDPHLTIDCHTTNGSRHGYMLTYAAPLNPSGAAEPIEFLRDTMLPEISARLEKRTGYRSFFYGNFNRDQTVWATYSAHPRFGGPYRGLRGRMSILAEAYSYAPFRERVLSTLEFVREILRYAAENAKTIREIHARATEETIRRGRNPQPDDVVGVRHKIAAFPEPVTIPGGSGRPGRAGETPAAPDDSSATPKEFRVVHLGRFEPTVSVSRPWAYVLPQGQEGIVEMLRLHGVEVEPFAGKARVEVYTVAELDRAGRPFQGHHLLSLDVEASSTMREFEDAHIVHTEQPLGDLIVYLLEPQSEDGFAAWGLFGEVIETDREYPVVRVRHADDVIASTQGNRQ